MQNENKEKDNPYLIQDAANHLSALGCSVIPVNNRKEPTVPAWKHFQEKIPDAFQINDMFIENTYGIAIIGGKVSGNLEILDEDCKYDLTGTMHDEFVSILNEQVPGLYDKLLIQKTVNNGYHYIYRCAQIEGSLKLASRPVSEEEQKKNPKETEKVLYETKGDRGYIVCAPTPGYEIIQRSFESIPKLTPEERESLLSVARSFDQLPDIFKHNLPKNTFASTGITPFDDYNQRGDVIGLLEKHGWTVVSTKGSKTNLKRPGVTNAKQSGNYDADKYWFSVFSTSTEFEIRKAYLPYAVFAKLECNNDFSAAAKRLYDEGYGDRRITSSLTYDKFFKTAISNSTIEADFDISKIIINSIDLLKYDNEENRYLLDPIIPKIGTGVLAGMPDTGKSQFARQLCLSVATGMNHFLDYAISLTHASALYISTEDDENNTSFLLSRQMKGLQQSATENLNFIFADTLNQDEILFTLDKHLTEKPCDLVVVDSFGDIFQGNDSNNTIAMRKNVRSFDYFAKKHQCFILFVHHINKNAYKDSPHQRHVMGGGGLTQKVRLALQLSQGEMGIKYLSVVKGNYCPREVKENTMELTFDEKQFLFTRTGKTFPTDSINLDQGKEKDTKFSKLVTLADEIFGTETISYKEFCKRFEAQTGKSQPTAKREHAAMKDSEIIIQDKETKHWKLNGTAATIENPKAPEEPLPF